MKKENTYIYSLVCPLSGQIVYIGKANNYLRRSREHVTDQRGISLDKMLWLDKLKQAKLKPEVLLLEEVSINDWKFWEDFYIDYFKSLGFKLLNKGSKQGLTYSNSQSFKKNNIPFNKGKKLVNGKYR